MLKCYRQNFEDIDSTIPEINIFSSWIIIHIFIIGMYKQHEDMKWELRDSGKKLKKKIKMISNQLKSIKNEEQIVFEEKRDPVKNE